MNKQDLINKGNIEFESEFDMMEVIHFEHRCVTHPFMIRLNAKIIDSFKTFKGLENRVNKLIKERNLELV
ncbi:hypothetical protein COB55_05090 [Candidatus Wolfebacteria bacterium]|nr:MAG: hypothetical protein COB55_05090 [Candidatus Wolfebacteria bacterium]